MGRLAEEQRRYVAAEALDIASRSPPARAGAIEVRPVRELQP